MEDQHSNKPHSPLNMPAATAEFNISHDHRHSMPMMPPDMARGEMMPHVRAILDLLGLKGSGTNDTPRRVAEALLEFNQHLTVPDIAVVLKDGFEHAEGNAMVVQSGIPFRGLCEHHLLPFFGTCNFGYVPHERVVGLSKIARLVQAAGTWMPSYQEKITNQIANAFIDIMKPLGVIVVTRAIHTCMAVRGPNVPNVPTTVSSIHGVFRDVPAARQEFFALAGG